MQKHLFPKEIVEYSSEYHLWRNSVRSQVLYTSVVIILIIVLLLLPYLKIDVGVTSRGIIRPLVEKNAITSLVSGKIVSLRVKENQKVHKDDIIATVESSEIRARLLLNKTQEEKLYPHISDLKMLISVDSSSALSGNLFRKLRSPVYRQAFIHFSKTLQKIRQQIQNRERLYRQNKYLYNKKAVSKSEYQKSKYDLSLVRNAYDVQFTEQVSQWQIKLEQDQQELEKLMGTRKELLTQMKQYTIRAPIAGTVQSLAGLSSGSYVYLNQKLAEISPDTGLIAECYVTPKDIGLLKNGMKGKFQIDAFDYNQWGTIEGHISEISSDVAMANNQPVFKVRCKLNHPFLALQNGFQGYLKKGMTLQGRFIITKRSVLQLLNDRVNDWLNPLWNTTHDNAPQSSTKPAFGGT